MREIKLLIADPDSAFAHALRGYLSQNPAFLIVGTVSDGRQALAQIHSLKPDLVLSDLILPSLDGLNLMKEIQSMRRPPVFICHSEFYTQSSIEAARRNGASYFLCKPVSFRTIETVLLEYGQIACERNIPADSTRTSQQADDRAQKIYHVIQSLGFSPKYNGSLYLAESVALALDSPMMLHNLSVGLYRALSERMRVSPASIERNMRTAISATDADGHLSEQLGNPPTNKTCIQYIVKLLNL